MAHSKLKSGLLLLALSLTATCSWAYYGRMSQEAVLSYEGQIELPRTNSERQVLAAIDDQVQYLMGTFQSASFQKEFGFPGVLGEDHTIKLTTSTVGRKAGLKIYSYRFSGKVVFDKLAFRAGQERSVPLKLPLAPSDIYDMGMVGSVNLCTDSYYNSLGDFWYFWDPEQKGCPLKGNTTDVLRISGELKPLPNTVLTYPEYNRFYGDNGNGNVTEFSVFLGYIDQISHINAPHRRDEGFETLQYITDELTKLDFTVVEKISGFKQTQGSKKMKSHTVPGANFYKVFEKKVMVNGEEKIMRVKVLLADTAIDSTDNTFHQYLVKAFKESDAVIYDGHSGLGGNLDISRIPDIKFDPKKYQIFYFNGCSSYPYYNGMFSDAKGGTKSVDILTAGLETSTATSGTNVMAFLNRFITGSEVSYQTILSEMEKSNLKEGTYLLGVNGDEDNKFRPAN